MEPSIWSHQYSALGQTIGHLKWMTNQMRGELAAGAEITPQDYRFVLGFIERMAGELKPLQDYVVQERR